VAETLSLHFSLAERHEETWRFSLFAAERARAKFANADAAELLMELLRGVGHEVAVGHDGPQALVEAARFDPEIAILDIGLPVMDGYELARRLIATIGRPPFMIALTGYGQEKDRQHARDAGFDEHIVKPVDPNRLIKLIDKASPAVCSAER